MRILNILKSNKVKLFLVFIILVVILLLGFLRGKGETEEKVKLSVLPTLSIPKDVKGPYPISLSLKPEGFNFPSQLPLLRVSGAGVDGTRAREIAKNLDITSEPLIVEDTREGTKYIWSTKDHFLFITLKSGTIKYGMATSDPPKVVNKQINDENLIKIAEQFLTKNLNFSQDSIKQTSVNYYAGSPTSEGFNQTEKKEAEIYQINFTYGSSDYEILSLDPNKPLLFVQILPDGSIYSTGLVIFSAIEKSNEKYDIKNLQDLSLGINQAILINVQNDYLSLPELRSARIKSIDVSEIKLAYLFTDSTANLLQPVFLLEGKIEIIGSTANRAQLYLPAIKNR